MRERAAAGSRRSLVGRGARALVALAVLATTLVWSVNGATQVGAIVPHPDLPEDAVRVPSSVGTYELIRSSSCHLYVYLEFDGSLYGYPETGPGYQPGTVSVYVYNPEVGHPDPVSNQFSPRGPRQVQVGNEFYAAYQGENNTLFQPTLTGVGTVDDPNSGCYPDRWAARKASALSRASSLQLWSEVAGPQTAPQADFDWTVTDLTTHEVTFTNRSSDQEDSYLSLTHEWDFGDGSPVVTGTDPVHQFPRNGIYQVRLKVSDPGDLSATVTKTVTVTAGLVVNSTGDAGAVEPTERGCDTGGTIGDDEAECTLRAAVEAANVAGGGEITFDIEAGGTPTIALGAPLPALTTVVSIDGTTQPSAERVAVVGTGEAAFVVTGGTATLRGLAVRGTEIGIRFDGGEGHVIDGMVLGADADGTVADTDTTYGVAVLAASGVTIRDSVFGANGVLVAPGSSGTRIEGNTIGVRGDGATPLGEPEVGVFTTGPGTVVSGNTVRAETVAVAVVAASATGSSVTDNRLGTSAAGTAAFAGTGYGVRVDGAPEVEVSGNRVSSTTAAAAIVASGRVEMQQEEDLTITIYSPLTEPADGPVTGGGTTIAGNVVGVVGPSGVVEDHAGRGIMLWSGASESTIVGNTVGSTDLAAIDVTDTTGAIVAGNHLGETTAGAPVPVGTGVGVFTSSGVTIGGDTPNVIRATELGIGSTDTSAVQVVGNVVVGDERGIDVAGDAAVVTANVVTGAVDGVSVAGEGVTVDRNRIGVPVDGDTPVGAAGNGVTVVDGDATLTGNVIAGFAGNGVVAEDEATFELRGNRIWASGGEPVVSPNGPEVPELTAVRTGTGDGERITVVLTDLPQGDAGRIEVFANPTCGAEGGEAELVLDITRTKSPDQQARVVQLTSTTRDHFTATYTSAEGVTSALTDCADATRYGDNDGDGSVDPFDRLLGREDDPTTGIVVTDNEKILMATVLPVDPDTGLAGGRLEQLGPVDDPTPHEHPAGWSLPYGVINFRISGIEPGARSAVALVDIDRPTAIEGDSYWKYGSPEPGQPAQWYRFESDAETGLGASVTTTDVPGVGFRRAVVLVLEDGARGDDDGGANGTITDPGGPVLEDGDAGPTPPEPEQPAPTPTTVPITVPTLSDPPATGGAGADESAAAAAVAPSGSLPYTGAPLAGLLAVAGIGIVGGGLLVARSRRAVRTRG